MLFQRNKEKKLKGSFTIEATLLMSFILPMLIALLMAGFYVHDRALLQGIACEAAARGNCLAMENGSASAVRKTIQERIPPGLMWAGNTGKQFQADEEQIHVSLSGTFRFPGFSSFLLPGGNRPVNGEWERTVYHPAKLIRKVRGAKALIDLLGEARGVS